MVWPALPRHPAGHFEHARYILFIPHGLTNIVNSFRILSFLKNSLTNWLGGSKSGSSSPRGGPLQARGGKPQMKAGGQWIERKRLMRCSSRREGNMLSPADFFATDSPKLQLTIKGLPSEAARTWQWKRLKLDTIPPQFTVKGSVNSNMRRETTMTLAWIAERRQSGEPKLTWPICGIGNEAMKYSMILLTDPFLEAQNPRPDHPRSAQYAQRAKANSYQ